MTRTLRRLGPVAAVFAMTLAAAACGADDGTTSDSADQALSGAVAVDGSSTVAPLSEAAADIYREEQPGVNVTVGTSGTGGGFEKFCEGPSTRSRPRIFNSPKEKRTEDYITGWFG